MRAPIASAKPRNSIVKIVGKDKKVSYHLFNKLRVYSEPDWIWRMAKLEYKRAIRSFRERIDSILAEVYPTIPVYRDRDITDIMLLIKQFKEDLPNDDLAFIIFELIQTRKDGNEEGSEKGGKESSSKERSEKSGSKKSGKTGTGNSQRVSK